jgi:hypothetical protein
MASDNITPWVTANRGRILGAKSSAVKRVAEVVTQEYVTRFAMQAAEATNALAIVERLHDCIE